MSERYVETILPANYLYELGVYLQTCAQIEHWTSSAICKLEGLNASDAQWQQRHNEVKNQPPSKLISSLRLASKKDCECEEWFKYFDELAGWMHRYIDNRHLAVHGAHYFNGDSVIVDAVPRAGRKQLTEVTSETVKELTNDADRILRALRQFVTQVEYLK